LPESWSQLEVELIVADYLEMLSVELRGEKFNKAEHGRRLKPLLNGRSDGSIEFKHANISAVLIELGFPYISGYKPRGNYQSLLRQVLHGRLVGDQTLVSLVATDAEGDVVVPSYDDILQRQTQPPVHPLKPAKAQPGNIQHFPHHVNYLEVEARNRKLGLAGEEFVVRYEQARLCHAGHENLAGLVEHVSKTQGDGAGYDVLSFETSGKERLIEVKTTKHGAETPFYVSRNELRVSEEQEPLYWLYRVYGFRADPKFFQLSGALSTTCLLDPSVYRATVAYGQSS